MLRSALAFMGFLCIAGCATGNDEWSDGSPTDDSQWGDDGDGGQGGGGGQGGSGESEPPCFATMSSGVLTNMKNVIFSGSGAPVVIRTARVEFKPIPNSSTYVRWLGEVENIGDSTLCLLGMDAEFNGTNIVTSIDAQPHYMDSAIPQLSTDCLAPGQRGGFLGTGYVPPYLADSLSSITYKITHYTTGYPFTHPGAPYVTTSGIGEKDGLYFFTGTYNTTKSPIEFLNLKLYGRDECGLVSNVYEYFHSGAVPTSSEFDFETYPGEGKPMGAPLITSNFSVNTSGNFAPSSEAFLRQQAAIQAARDQIRSTLEEAAIRPQDF